MNILCGQNISTDFGQNTSTHKYMEKTLIHCLWTKHKYVQCKNMNTFCG